MNQLSIITINITEKFKNLIASKCKNISFECVFIKSEIEDGFENIIKPGIDFIFYGYSDKSFKLKELSEYIKSNDLDISLMLCVKSKIEFDEIEALQLGASGYICEKESDRIPSEIYREHRAKIEKDEKMSYIFSNVSDFQREMEERINNRTKEYEESSKKFLREIAEREKAETSLRNTESFLTLILENFPNMIFVKDAETLQFTYINKAGEELTGFNRDFIIGKTVYDIYNKDHADYYYANDQKVLLLDKPVDFQEELFYTRENKLKLFNTKKILVKDSDGEPKHIIGISDDITDEYTTRNELKNSEIRFSKIFNSSPIPMTVCRASDNILVDANQSYLELLGYSKEEILGKDLSKIGIWKNPEVRTRLIEDVLKNGAIHNLEIELITKSGEEKITLMSFDSIKFNEEAIIICMGLDITNRKRIDNELRNALEKQKELNMLRTQFISMISHEFRTPLTSIMLSTDLLKRYSDKWDDEEKEKHFKRIQDTILKMTQLMENVLLIGRMDSGRFEFHPEKIDFRSFCQSIASNIEFNTGNKYTIDFSYECVLDEIFIDENLLGLIITNLLTNAVKYSPSHQPIDFRVECSDNKTCAITIADKGIGIPDHELHHLFKSFYRASNVGSIAGYGLGLHIVKKCVEAHSGVIEVDSEVGRGTTFVVTIPIDQEDHSNIEFDL